MIKASGHNAREELADITSKESELCSMVERWSDEGKITWLRACAALQDMSLSPAQVQSVVERCQDRLNHKVASKVISASYRVSSSSFSHHNISIPLSDVGFDLSSDNILYVSSPTKDKLARWTEGIIVNTAPTGNDSGNVGRGGIFVQASSSMNAFGWCSKGLIISLCDENKYVGPINSGKIIKHDEVGDDLRDYCDKLIGSCEKGEREIYEVFGDDPAKEIRKTIYSLARWPR